MKIGFKGGPFREYKYGRNPRMAAQLQ